MFYWDSSVILKLYVSEKDSDAWQAIALAEDRPLRSSEFLLAEMAFALRQKECRAEIETGAARHLYRLFRDDVSDGRIEVFPVGMDVLEESAVLAVSEKPKNMPLLRTLDGLHLATARLLKCRTIATADSRMQDVAGAMGFALVPVGK